MQDFPGAPGTARQGRTGTSVPTDSGGVATQPRAPSHERPLAAQRAAGHGWLSAALEAPGDDVPLATTARAPGHHCLSAALQAPGVDLPLAITAGAPGHHRLSAASIATVSLPAGLHRLRQECLPRVPANPRTPICSPAHRDTTHTRTTDFRAIPSPCTAGGPQGGQVTSPARHPHRLNRHSRFPPSSFPRKREGGFTFEVQHFLPEDFRGCPVVQALAGRIIVQLHQLRKPFRRHGREVGLAGQPAAQASDGVFDAALLPGGMGVTEERLDAEGMELVMAGEFGAVVEGDGLAPGGGQRAQQPGEGGGDRGRRFAWRPVGEQQAGVAFMHGQHGLARGAEEHQIGFPMARDLAVGGRGGPFLQGTPEVDEGSSAAAAAPAPAPFPLGAGEIVAPGPIRLGARGLGVDEAVDRLMGDDRRSPLPPETGPRSAPATSLV